MNNSRINNQGGLTNPITKILKVLVNDLLLENGQIEINPQEVSKWMFIQFLPKIVQEMN